MLFKYYSNLFLLRIIELYSISLILTIAFDLCDDICRFCMSFKFLKHLYLYQLYLNYYLLIAFFLVLLTKLTY